jgi:hypothetical protein
MRISPGAKTSYVIEIMAKNFGRCVQYFREIWALELRISRNGAAWYWTPCSVRAGDPFATRESI